VGYAAIEAALRLAMLEARPLVPPVSVRVRYQDLSDADWRKGKAVRLVDMMTNEVVRTRSVAGLALIDTDRKVRAEYVPYDTVLRALGGGEAHIELPDPCVTLATEDASASDTAQFDVLLFGTNRGNNGILLMWLIPDTLSAESQHALFDATPDWILFEAARIVAAMWLQDPAMAARAAEMAELAREKAHSLMAELVLPDKLRMYEDLMGETWGTWRSRMPTRWKRT
jgi:hypothetical protein